MEAQSTRSCSIMMQQATATTTTTTTTTTPSATSLRLQQLRAKLNLDRHHHHHHQHHHHCERRVSSKPLHQQTSHDSHSSLATADTESSDTSLLKRLHDLEVQVTAAKRMTDFLKSDTLTKKSLRQRIHQLENQLEEQPEDDNDDNVSSNQEARRYHQVRIDVSSKALADAQDENRKHVVEIKQLQDRLEEQRQLQAAATQEIQELKNSNANVVPCQSAAQASLQQQLQAKEDALSETTRQLEQHQELHRQTMLEVKNRVAQQQRQFKLALQQQLAAKDEEYQQQILEFKQQQQQLEQHKNQAAAGDDQVNELQAQLEALQQQQLNEAQATLAQEKASLQQQLAEKERLWKQSQTALQQQQQMHTDTMQEIQKRVVELQQEYQLSLEQHLAAKEKLHQQEFLQLQHQQQPETNHEELGKMQEQLDTVQLQLQEVQQELSCRESELATARMSCQDQTVGLDHLRKQMLEQESALLETAHQLEQHLELHQQMMQEVKNRAAQQQHEFQLVLQQQLAAQEEEHRKEILELKQLLEQKESEHSNYDNDDEVEELHAQLEVLEAKLEELQDQLGETRETAANLESQLAAKDGALNEVQNALFQHQQMHADTMLQVQKRVAQLQQKFQLTLQQQLAAKEKQHQEELRRLQGTNPEELGSMQLQQVQRELSARENELASLKKAYQDQTVMVENLQKSLSEQQPPAQNSTVRQQVIALEARLSEKSTPDAESGTKGSEEKKVRQLEQKLECSRAECEKQKELIEKEYQAKLQTLQTEMVDMEDHLNKSYNDSLESMMKQIAQLKSRLADADEQTYLLQQQLQLQQKGSSGSHVDDNSESSRRSSKKLTFLEHNATFHTIPQLDELHAKLDEVEAQRQAEKEFYETQEGEWKKQVEDIFLFTAMIFVLYDWLLRRQQKFMKSAQKTNAIVSSIFPPKNTTLKQIVEEEPETTKPMCRSTSKTELKQFLEEHDGRQEHGHYPEKPVADLFPDTTIFFADIGGFTAWSSEREPSQVFVLLETIYGYFDEIALRRRVFKVETVGDCYVAVAGLPDPCKDHAVVMARFANECLEKFNVATKSLEVELGPDTSELSLRVGLHSGPVTAGFLRGHRARFQLFGDTMNTASRIESNSKPGCIHVSQETADLLLKAGKRHWVTKREDKIVAKGKGEMDTYWVNLRSDVISTTRGRQTSLRMTRAENESTVINVSGGDVTNSEVGLSPKIQRLVDWNVDVLLRLLRAIEARRAATQGSPAVVDLHLTRPKDVTVLDEVQEIIHLPKFDAKAAKKEVSPDSIDISQTVRQELHEFVTAIALMYRDNPFHNFEHCSHVTMSVSKLLSRVVAPSDVYMAEGDAKGANLASTLHDHTYGITSDPLTQFACVFSALIHDVDHTGVPNFQLIKENPALAKLYKEKSIAEQNSVDLAWDLLMDEGFANLRKTIFTTNEELLRFRHLVVNSVMATDIMDRDLKALRNARWERVFSEEALACHAALSADEIRNRKATIVIEHIIQASDIAHTMQHWHVYRKWNERLFREMYKAYKAGRADRNPADLWYRGEIGFFDFYIIPLVEKLKACGVFGVSSAEYLLYAQRNRTEWEAKGQQLVEEMLAAINAEEAQLCPEASATPVCPEEATPVGPEEATPVCPEEATPVCPEEATPVCPEEATPVCPEEATPVCPEEATPVCPEEATPICPEEATPICPEEATPVCPEEATPVCPESSGISVDFTI